MQKKKSGFTIIELIVVIGIISILLTILIPALSRTKVEAKKVACAGNMTAWGKSVLHYAVSQQGALPNIAAANEPFYAASAGVKQFFANAKLNKKIAYSPSSKVLIVADDWINHEWQTQELTWLDPIDNADDTQSPDVAAYEIVRDDELGGFTAVAGSWLTYLGAGVNGAQARYSDTANAKASWTFTVPTGYGTLQLEALIQKGQSGHPHVQFEVIGRDSDVGNPQLSEEINLAQYPNEMGWVTLGNFHFYGGTRTVSVKSIGAGGVLPGTPADVIIDSLDGSPHITNTGFVAVGYIGWASNNSLYDQNASKGTKSVKYTPTIPAAGYYNIYVYRMSSAGFANNVPVDIVDKNGTTTVQDNQQLNNKVWQLLPGGPYEFEAGSSGYVLIRTDGTTSSVIADAVRFTQVIPGGPRVWADAIRITGNFAFSGVEPTSDGWHVLDGIWELETSPTPEGSNYLKVVKDGMPKRAAWIFPIDETAEYEVYAFWPPSSNNTTNARFTIFGSDSSVSTEVSQTDTSLNDPANNFHWRRLGAANFTMGTSGKVEIFADDNDGKILAADAVRLVKKGILNAASTDMIGFLYLGYRTTVAGGMLDQTVILPNDIQALANPSGVPLIVDMYAPGGADWATTHEDGIHIFYMDGRCEWVEADKTVPRWRDAYLNIFKW